MPFAPPPLKDEVLYPKCPHCNESPARVVCSPFTLGIVTALTIYCGNPECCKIFTIVPIGPAQKEEPLIAMPETTVPRRRTN